MWHRQQIFEDKEDEFISYVICSFESLPPYGNIFAILSLFSDYIIIMCITERNISLDLTNVFKFKKIYIGII